GQGELDVDKPAYAHPGRDRLGGGADLGDHRIGQGDRRQHACGVTGVDTGLLDVLHHAAQVQLLAVVEGVHVDLDRLVQEPVHQHRGGQYAVPSVGAGGAGDVVHQLVGVIDDLHPAAAEHVGRSHQDRVPDPGGDIACLVQCLRSAELRG